jgi:hypothetical protein
MYQYTIISKSIIANIMNLKFNLSRKKKYYSEKNYIKLLNNNIVNESIQYEANCKIKM